MINNDTNSSHNFTIRDNSSDFAQFLPDKYIEPLVIIARIKGYDGIDDYILDLIQDRVEMFTDTRDSIEYEEFQQYMHNTVKGKDVPNEWAGKQQKEEEDRESNNENASKFVKQVNEEYHHHHHDMKHTTEDDKKEKEDLK